MDDKQLKILTNSATLDVPRLRGSTHSVPFPSEKRGGSDVNATTFVKSRVAANKNREEAVIDPLTIKRPDSLHLREHRKSKSKLATVNSNPRILADKQPQHDRAEKKITKLVEPDASIRHDSKGPNDRGTGILRVPGNYEKKSEPNAALVDSYKELLIRLSRAQVKIDELSLQNSANEETIRNWRPVLREALLSNSGDSRSPSISSRLSSCFVEDSLRNLMMPHSQTSMANEISYRAKNVGAEKSLNLRGSYGSGPELQILNEPPSDRSQITRCFPNRVVNFVNVTPQQKCEEYLNNSDFLKYAQSSFQCSPSIGDPAKATPPFHKKSWSVELVNDKFSGDFSDDDVIVPFILNVKVLEDRLDQLQNEFKVDDFLSCNAGKDQKLSKNLSHFMREWNALKEDWSDFRDKAYGCIFWKRLEGFDDYKEESIFDQTPSSFPSLPGEYSSSDEEAPPSLEDDYKGPNINTDSGFQEGSKCLNRLSGYFSNGGSVTGDSCNRLSGSTGNEQSHLLRLLCARFLRSEMSRMENKMAKVESTLRCILGSSVLSDKVGEVIIQSTRSADNAENNKISLARANVSSLNIILEEPNRTGNSNIINNESNNNNPSVSTTIFDKCAPVASTPNKQMLSTNSPFKMAKRHNFEVNSSSISQLNQSNVKLNARGLYKEFPEDENTNVGDCMTDSYDSQTSSLITVVENPSNADYPLGLDMDPSVVEESINPQNYGSLLINDRIANLPLLDKTSDYQSSTLRKSSCLKMSRDSIGPLKYSLSNTSVVFDGNHPCKCDDIIATHTVHDNVQKYSSTFSSLNLKCHTDYSPPFEAKTIHKLLAGSPLSPLSRPSPWFTVQSQSSVNPLMSTQALDLKYAATNTPLNTRSSQSSRNEDSTSRTHSLSFSGNQWRDNMDHKKSSWLYGTDDQTKKSFNNLNGCPARTRTICSVTHIPFRSSELSKVKPLKFCGKDNYEGVKHFYETAKEATPYTRRAKPIAQSDIKLSLESFTQNLVKSPPHPSSMCKCPLNSNTDNSVDIHEKPPSQIVVDRNDKCHYCAIRAPPRLNSHYATNVGGKRINPICISKSLTESFNPVGSEQICEKHYNRPHSSFHPIRCGGCSNTPCRICHRDGEMRQPRIPTVLNESYGYQLKGDYLPTTRHSSYLFKFPCCSQSLIHPAHNNDIHHNFYPESICQKCCPDRDGMVCLDDIMIPSTLYTSLWRYIYQHHQNSMDKKWHKSGKYSSQILASNLLLLKSLVKNVKTSIKCKRSCNKYNVINGKPCGRTKEDLYDAFKYVPFYDAMDKSAMKKCHSDLALMVRGGDANDRLLINYEDDYDKVPWDNEIHKLKHHNGKNYCDRHTDTRKEDCVNVCKHANATRPIRERCQSNMHESNGGHKSIKTKILTNTNANEDSRIIPKGNATPRDGNSRDIKKGILAAATSQRYIDDRPNSDDTKKIKIWTIKNKTLSSTKTTNLTDKKISKKRHDKIKADDDCTSKQQILSSDGPRAKEAKALMADFKNIVNNFFHKISSRHDRNKTD